MIALVALALNFVVPGPTGSAGPTGQAGGVSWAVVNHNGTLVYANGATAAVNKSTGTYQVTFSADVSGCALVATVGLAGSVGQAGPSVASVTPVSGNSHAVQVSVTNITSTLPTAAGFSVVAVCSPSLFAVVGTGGGVIHGNGAVSATTPGTGVYNVTFNQYVSNCSFLATPATTGIVTVANALKSPASVIVTTWSEAGAATDLSFNLVVLCGNSNNWAVVSSTGVEARGTSNGTEALGGAGAFQVNITAYAYNCAVIGTLGLSAAGTPVPGEITYAGRNDQYHAFFIATSDLSGTETPEPFHFGAFC